jgi:hypothetical protein
MPTKSRKDLTPGGGPKRAHPVAIKLFNRIKELPQSDQLVVWRSLAQQAGDGYSQRQLLSLNALRAYQASTRLAPARGPYDEWRKTQRQDQWPSSTFIQNSFKTWGGALAALGIAPTANAASGRLRANGPKYSREEIIAALQFYARSTGNTTVQQKAYIEWARDERSKERNAGLRTPASQKPFRENFDSWAEAVSAAGLTPPLARHRVGGPRIHYTRKEMLRWIAEWSGQSPAPRLMVASYDEFARRRRGEAEACNEVVWIPSGHVILGEFGTFPDALREAGLVEGYEYRRLLRRVGRYVKVSDDELLAVLSAAIDDNNGELTTGGLERWVEQQLRNGTRDPRELPSWSLVQSRWPTVKAAFVAVLTWRERRAANQEVA